MSVRVSVDGHSAKEGVRVPELELGSCESSVMGAMNCTGGPPEEEGRKH